MRIFLSVAVFLLLLVCAVPGFAAITVMYMSGECSVDLLGTGEWKKTAIDMELKKSSVLKTGTYGEIEIDIEGQTISIGPNRTARIGDLIGSVEKKKKMGWLKGLKKYTGSVTREEGEWSETALAGVRGAPSEEEELEWFDDSEMEMEDDPMARGINCFEAGDYSKAIEELTAVVDEEGVDTRGGEAAYLLGLSFFNVMRFEEAARYLEGPARKREVGFYGAALLYYSVAHYFMQNYDTAIDGLVVFTGDLSDNELAPYALLMLGKSYKDKGDPKRARQFFLKLDESTGLYDAAQEELEEL